jgi:4-hydroxy-tetrahydrodipicolinate synthase
MIFNAGWASTRETVALKYAKTPGPRRHAVEPYFFHPTPEGMARHYLDIAEATDFPVIAYNIPSFAGNLLMPDIMDDFARDSRIVGLKDSGGDAAALSDFILRAPESFSVMVGMDSRCTGGAGASMAIGSTSIAPELC